MTETRRKIVFANDHAAIAMREAMLEHLRRDPSIEIIDLGVADGAFADYPDQAEKAAAAIASGRASVGVILCGTGIGMSIAANKFPGIRCALCSDTYDATMARQHNDANILALRGREFDPEINIQILDTFLQSEFSKGERHLRRLEKIKAIEAKSTEKPDHARN